MSETEFVLEENAREGTFFYRQPGSEDAVITYLRDGDVMRIDHTYVPDAYQGQGIALALVRQVVRHARETGRKIVPQCSYAALQFARHPAWHDVLAR